MTRRHVPGAANWASCADVHSMAARYICTTSAQGWQRKGIGALTQTAGTALNTRGRTWGPVTGTKRQVRTDTTTTADTVDALVARDGNSTSATTWDAKKLYTDNV